MIRWISQCTTFACCQVISSWRWRVQWTTAGSARWHVPRPASHVCSWSQLPRIHHLEGCC